jgi:hypothetical protein
MMMKCTVALLFLLSACKGTSAADGSYLRDLEALGASNQKLVLNSMQRRLQVSVSNSNAEDHS